MRRYFWMSIGLALATPIVGLVLVSMTDGRQSFAPAVMLGLTIIGSAIAAGHATVVSLVYGIRHRRPAGWIAAGLFGVAAIVALAYCL
jgi:hypothetical protein